MSVNIPRSFRGYRAAVRHKAEARLSVSMAGNTRCAELKGPAACARGCPHELACSDGSCVLYEESVFGRTERES